MSANPQKRPDNQHVDLITRFREEYAKALDEARVSVDHTNTEGWRRLYVNERSEESQIIRQLSKDIAAAAQTIQLVGPTEDGDKELGDIKKRCTAIRERREAFDRNTVAPVKEPVEQCGRVIERFRSSARVQEQDAPLHNVGLENLMSEAISLVEKPQWNEETGRVEISAPAGR